MRTRATDQVTFSVVGRRGLALLVLALSATTAAAQQVPEEVPCDAALRAEIIDSVGAALREVYVFPDVAASMEQHLRERLGQGVYDAVTTVSQFAEVLTRDLRAISHDRHLRVGYASPELVARMTSPRDSVDMEREQRQEMARENYLFRKIEILAGNVGYLRFDAFVDASMAGPTAIAAMNFLANVDALIVDLRFNGGGSPSLIQLISSYFFDEPVHLNSFYIRKTDETNEFWTQAYVQGPRLTETPIYVLTSERTFSGAEEFSYNLKNLERATIVGDTTGGGAHPTEGRLFANLNVGMSLPFGRAVNPITGTNWEGVGVIPDVVVNPERALDRAHLMALEELSADETNEARAFRLRWAIDGIRARLNPVSVTPAQLRAYAGKYGPRTLSFEGGALYYQRAGNPAMRAIPMGERIFRFDEIDYFRLEVVVDAAGRPLKLVGHYDNGTSDESPRTGGR